MLENAIRLPSALIAGATLPSSAVAFPAGVTLTGETCPAAMSRTHTSESVFVSGSAEKSSASVANATRLPSASIAGEPEPSLPEGPAAPFLLTSVVVPAPRSRR